MHIEAFEKLECLFCLVIDRAWKPPAHQLDVMLLECVQFVVPLRDVLGTVIIDEFFDAHLLQHRRTFLRTALLRIKRYDAPRGEVGFVEEVGGGE